MKKNSLAWDTVYVQQWSVWRNCDCIHISCLQKSCTVYKSNANTLKSESIHEPTIRFILHQYHEFKSTCTRMVCMLCAAAATVYKHFVCDRCLVWRHLTGVKNPADFVVVDVCRKGKWRRWICSMRHCMYLIWCFSAGRSTWYIV